MNKNFLRMEPNQQGFTLIEALLVIGVSAVVLLGSVRLADNWAQDLQDVQEARYLRDVMNKAQKYVEDNFDYIWSDALLMGEADPVINADGSLTWTLNNPGRVLRLGFDAPSAGRPANFFLQDNIIGTLVAGFPSTTPLGNDTKIFIRNNGVSPVQEKRTLEVFVVTDSLDGTMLPIVRANNIAVKLGPEAAAFNRVDPGTATIFTGGFCTAGNIVRSIYGLWEINADDLSGANAVNGDNGFCPITQPAINGRGSYVILRRVIVDNSNILNEVLYRVPIPNRPAANQMQANLDMSNNDITGANGMSADKVVVNGNVELMGEASRMYIEETARFAGVGSRIIATPLGTSGPDPDCTWSNINAGNRTLNPAAVNPCALRGGNLQIQGISGVAGQDSLIVDSLNAPGSRLSAQRFQATNLTVGGIALYNNDVTVNTGTVGGLAAGEVIVNNSVQTQIFQTGDMTVNNPNAAVGGLVSQVAQAQNINVNNLDINRDVDGTKGNIQINGQLVMNDGLNANEAEFTNLQSCRTNTIIRFDLDGDGNRYEIPDDIENVPIYDCVLGP